MNKELSIPSSPTSGSEAQTFLERNGDDTENGTFRTFRNPCSQGCLSEVTDVSPPPPEESLGEGETEGSGRTRGRRGGPAGPCVRWFRLLLLRWPHFPPLPLLEPFQECAEFTVEENPKQGYTLKQRTGREHPTKRSPPAA